MALREAAMCEFLPLSVLAAAMLSQGSPPATDDYVQLRVGDARINASNMRPYSGAWRVLENRGDGQLVEVERSSEKVELIRTSGRSLWRQVQHEIAGASGMSDVLVMTDATTFAPILVEQKNARDGSLKRIRYDRNGATIECGGSLCPPNVQPPVQGTTTHTIPTAVPAFDFWGGSYGILFATLPLKVGAKFLMPVFHPVQGLIQLKVEVTGEERVNAGGGRMVKAFRIITPQTGWIYHVSKKPPYWLRLEYRKKADGVLQITERV